MREENIRRMKIDAISAQMQTVLIRNFYRSNTAVTTDNKADF